MLASALPPFVMENLWFVILIGSTLTWPVAWIADGLFGHNGFGLLGNYVFLIVGAVAGAILLMLDFGSATRAMNEPHWPFFAAVAGSTFTLLGACFVKRFTT